METDWESMYRSWKEGLCWANRTTMFSRCDLWLSDMQDSIWTNRDFGVMGNYIMIKTQGSVPTTDAMNPVQNLEVAHNSDESVGLDETMGDIETLNQFQWP
jgi:hypothetical protein